ncbi:MAG: hypothetical protein RIB60_05100 [Phycisphaerales bacterium]
MAPDPDPTKRRATPMILGTLMIVAAIALAIFAAGVGVGFLYGGLSEEFLNAASPGEHEIDADAGSYQLIRPADARPDDAGTLTVRSLDPDAATITPAKPGSYIEYNSVRYDRLALIELHEDGPVPIALEGDAAHFPVSVRREQIAWMSTAAAVTAVFAVLPVGLFVAGVVLIVREKQRQTRELVDFVSGVR